MKPSKYTQPISVVVFVVAMVGGLYWYENRPDPDEKETPSNALVIVTKSTNACVSDMVRGTGFIVPRREAVVGVDQEGSKVSDVFVREGDTVTENQELARLTPPPSQSGGQGAQQSGGAKPPTSLRAPAAGLITEVRTAAGVPA